MPERQRILGPIEAVIGMLMIGVNTAAIMLKKTAVPMLPLFARITKASEGYDSMSQLWQDTHVQSLPSNIMAKIFDFHNVDYFELEPATQRGMSNLDI